MNWRSIECARGPCKMRGNVNAVVKGSKVYIKLHDSSPDSHVMCIYDSSSKTWEQLYCQTEHCSIAVVDNKLTTIGGKENNKETNCLYSLIEDVSNGKRWEVIFPAMKTCRSNTRSVCTGTHLLVAGLGIRNRILC